MAVDVLERWRDLGPVLWALAGAAALAWLGVLAAMAAATEPRRVRAGPRTLDLGGPEPPAVVNLITNDWKLRHEAVPATLLDLAARRHLAVEQIGDRTLVRLRRDRGDRDLTGYERLVLDHVRALSRHTADGFVPAEALTTGPEATSKGWWRNFQREVVDDARRRGVSAPRWSAGSRAVLVGLAVVVGLFAGLAASTLEDDPDDPDDGPVGAFLAVGGLTAGAGVAAASKLRGERDTPAGRDAAARWLGLRDHLGDNEHFQEQPPAAVAIWDRVLAHGAALGVAHEAVHTLPLGAESDRDAWSAVGGRWRMVRIRYPQRIPPGYGRHPALVALIGAGALALGIVLWPAAAAAGSAARDLIDDLNDDPGGQSAPLALRLGLSLALGFVFAAGAVFVAAGSTMIVCGLADLLRGRRLVEGRVLRARERGSDEHRAWYVAVDDGSADRVRAWRLARAPGVGQGTDVRAEVTPWLCHVRDLAPVRGPAPAQPSAR